MKKIYKSMFVLSAMMLCSVMVEANSNTYTSKDLNKIDANGDYYFPLAGQHLEYFKIHSLDGNKIKYVAPTVGSRRLEMGSIQDGTLTYEITWLQNKGYDMKMTKISIVALMENNTATCNCKIGNGSAVGMSGLWKTVSYENKKDGIENGVKLTVERSGAKQTMGFWISEITIEFEIYPNLVIVEPQPIKVTLDITNPVTCDLKACVFPLNDGHMDGTATIVCEGENLVKNDDVVYATQAGTYLVTVTQPGKENCHEEVVKTFNLVVNTVDPVVESALSDSNVLAKDSVMENVFVMSDTLGMTFSLSEEGIITYDAATNTITALNEGEVEMTVYQPAVPGLRGEYNKVYKFTVTAPTVPTYMEAIQQNVQVKKYLRKGVVVLERNGQLFNLMGTPVR